MSVEGSELTPEAVALIGRLLAAGWEVTVTPETFIAGRVAKWKVVIANATPYQELRGSASSDTIVNALMKIYGWLAWGAKLLTPEEL